MQSLEGHFLIAMPSLKDTYFERTVVYLCEHDSKGAMGLIINRPVGIKVNELLEQIAEENEAEHAPEFSEDTEQVEVIMGGPVTPDRGYVLHTPQSYWSNSHLVSDSLMLTSSRDILSAIGTEKGPENYIVALGHSGWSQGQLEQEIADNTWLTIPASQALLFDQDYDNLWEKATQTLGFDVWQISSQTGHA